MSDTIALKRVSGTTTSTTARIRSRQYVSMQVFLPDTSWQTEAVAVQIADFVSNSPEDLERELEVGYARLIAAETDEDRAVTAALLRLASSIGADEQ